MILGQILPVPNISSDIDLDTYKYHENEILIYTLLYNTKNWLYRGLKKKKNFFGQPILRGDANEIFFSYGYNKERSKNLYCTLRQPLPNIFQCTAFKKHVQYLITRNQELSFSKMFIVHVYLQLWIVRSL